MMGNQMGKDTQGGFLPSIPALGPELMGMLAGGKGGWAGINATSEEAQKQSAATKAEIDDIKRCYVAMFNSPAGQRVLEDLLDQTLRRGWSHPSADAGFEQEALHGKFRGGQNAIVIYMLKMIQDGVSLPAPKAAKSRSSTKKK